jgi:hypothetical protein
MAPKIQLDGTLIPSSSYANLDELLALDGTPIHLEVLEATPLNSQLVSVSARRVS